MGTVSQPDCLALDAAAMARLGCFGGGGSPLDLSVCLSVSWGDSSLMEGVLRATVALVIPLTPWVSCTGCFQEHLLPLPLPIKKERRKQSPAGSKGNFVRQSPYNVRRVCQGALKSWGLGPLHSEFTLLLLFQVTYLCTLLWGENC